MPISSIEELMEAIRACGLLNPEELAELTPEMLDRFFDPRGLAKYLLKQGWLTVYQVNHLLQGDAGHLVLGQYLLVDSLGEGAVSQVFKAWDTQRGFYVALKAIKEEHWENAEAAGRFKREMRIIGQMEHPNIVQAFDVDLDNPRHYFAMEYVEGTDLNKLVKLGGPLEVPTACNYVRQVADGLQYAHERGLVHRDLKPGNLFLTEGNLIKILDLGMARLRDPASSHQSASRLTLEGMMIGTPDYLAPEQARNPRGVDIRADIYSLGCTLYYLLAGQPPFPGSTAMQKLFLHQSAEVDVSKLPDVDGLADVIRIAMAKKPQDRYQIPADLAAALTPLCETE
jgi:serine/threonine protein kinase